MATLWIPGVATLSMFLAVFAGFEPEHSTICGLLGGTVLHREDVELLDDH